MQSLQPIVGPLRPHQQQLYYYRAYRALQLLIGNQLGLGAQLVGPSVKIYLQLLQGPRGPCRPNRCYTSATSRPCRPTSQAYYALPLGPAGPQYYGLSRALGALHQWILLVVQGPKAPITQGNSTRISCYQGKFSENFLLMKGIQLYIGLLFVGNLLRFPRITGKSGEISLFLGKFYYY